MGKGVERGNKRVYTFTLDKKQDDLIIKWLETQSTTKAVIEGLKLVMSGGNTVLQSNQMNQLIALLTANLMSNPNLSGIPQQSLEFLNQSEIEEDVDEDTATYVEEQAKRLSSFDPSNFGS